MSHAIARLLACWCCLLPLGLSADVRLPSLFSDHMVLAKAAAVPVWGKADPGERIRVALGGVGAEAIADAMGRWTIQLNLSDVAAGPFEMTVEGRNRVVIHDVVVGEVWLASGQSNMELPLRVTANADAEIASSANPFLRQFQVKKAGARRPADDCQGRWTVAGPTTAGEFSAVGYYFGKELQQDRKCPVGILHASHGGTSIEPWTPADCLDRIPSFKASAESKRKRADDYPGQKARFAADFTAWLHRHGREDASPSNTALFTKESLSPSDWITVNLPGRVPSKDLPSSGVFWIRRDIEVPAVAARQGFKVMIGPLDGDWQVYWNGRKIDEMTYAHLPGRGFPCYFPVSPECLHTGKNTLAIRIYSPVSPLGVSSPSLWAGPVDLNGKWQVRVERAFPNLPPEVMQTAPAMTYRLPEMLPGSLFNGMIHPLIPCTLAGVLWYQGESNVQRAYEYRTALPLLIEGWREKWRREDLPFYFCQVCNHFAKLPQPAESPWAELRESQSRALALPGTAQAVLVDLGEAGDLHPRDKKSVGHRLCLIAQAKHYNQPVVCSGPVYEAMSLEAGKVRLRFRNTAGGLRAIPLPPVYPVKTLTGETTPLVRHCPPGELEGFAICGEDHRWVWAHARIEGDSVLVWAEPVRLPVAVRYGWADNPTCNLVNGAGLPASPFRTDNFPATTQDSHF